MPHTLEQDILEGVTHTIERQGAQVVNVDMPIDICLRAPDIGNDIQDLNTDAVRRKIRPYYDRNKHVLPIYTHIAGYLKCMLDTCLDIDIVKTINEQKTEA